MEALVFLTYLAVILLLGILSTLLSNKIRIPNILLLIIIGILLNVVNTNLKSPIEFPGVFLTSISILALVMIVFDSASRFKLQQFDKLSIRTFILSVVFLVLNLVLLTVFLVWIFGIKSLFLAVLFSALMSGTDPAAVLSMFKDVKNKTLETLKIESLINTPLIVLLPFIILDIMKIMSSAEYTLSQFMGQMMAILQQFVTGIGAGVLVGLVVFKVMKKKYIDIISPLAIITAALLSYVLAEQLGGNGVLAVTTMGLLFGNIYVQQKDRLHEFSSIFANSLEILVFVLIGFIIELPLNIAFFFKSIALFLAYLLIRFIAIELSLGRMEYTLKDKIFMSLNVQKGIAVAVVAFTLITYVISEKISFLTLSGATEVLNLVLLFMIYSILLSTVITRVSKHFIKVEVK